MVPCQILLRSIETIFSDEQECKKILSKTLIKLTSPVITSFFVLESKSNFCPTFQFLEE